MKAPEAGEWFANGRGKKVKVLGVSDIQLPGDLVTVVAYRYEGRDYVHIRRLDEVEGWERVTE